ncbi:hypothetical protein [Acetobacter sp.]|uniref:hypothetical protein n=1 Tax=Acetobacter sp. TaxID=440 RepID=UPI0039E7424D
MEKTSKNLFPIFLLFVSFVLFAVSAVKGIGSPSFGDESGHMLGAFAVARGDILYQDYIDAHGPFIYMLTWVPALFVGFHYAYLLRCVSIFIVLITTLSLYYSPLFKTQNSRFLGMAFWLGSLSFFWVTQGLNMASYWTLGGGLIAIILSSSVLPAILNEPSNQKLCFMGGASLLFLCLTAYSFTPAAILLFAALCFAPTADRKKTIIYTLYGVLSAGGVFLIWMLSCGDIEGYIIYHFILNQFYYAHYISFGLSPLFQSLIPSFTPQSVMNSLGTLSFYVAVPFLFIKSRFKIPFVLTAVALLITQIRGGTEFQDGTFLMGSLILLTLTTVYVMKDKVLFTSILIPALWAVFYAGQHHAIFSPYGMSEKDMNNRGLHLFRENSSIGFSQIIQVYTNKNERILVIPYNPDVYIYSGRLSMKKYHEYLPWEADYAKHPWGGYERDICQDLLHKPPPVIYFDHYKVWGQWSAYDFIPCLNMQLTENYQQSTENLSLYIRKDRFLEHQTIQDKKGL